MNIFLDPDHFSDSLLELVPEIQSQTNCESSILDSQFPHVSKRIRDTWGTAECMDYLEELLNYTPDSQRPHGRQGFPFEAMKELSIVQAHHIDKFPNLNSKHQRRKDNPWK